VNPLRTLAAIVELKLADRQLAALIDETDQTDRQNAANARVDRADHNPHLPTRFRDPRDVADDRHTR
jgi:hypothetical protein